MPSWTLRVSASFEAAHHLTSYHGVPEPTHGHSFRVEVALLAETLDAEGMGFDFVAVQAALRELAAAFDHRNINDVPPFDRFSPTAEHLAVWFHDELARRFARPAGARLTEVTVWEGPGCSATYQP